MIQRLVVFKGADSPFREICAVSKAHRKTPSLVVLSSQAFFVTAG